MSEHCPGCGARVGASTRKQNALCIECLHASLDVSPLALRCGPHATATSIAALRSLPRAAHLHLAGPQLLDHLGERPVPWRQRSASLWLLSEVRCRARARPSAAGRSATLPSTHRVPPNPSKPPATYGTACHLLYIAGASGAPARAHPQTGHGGAQGEEGCWPARLSEPGCRLLLCMWRLLVVVLLIVLHSSACLPADTVRP